MQTRHVDVLIVGAGLSGIGAARHLQKKAPDRSYAIVEARSALGGTWDLFRYPGIRSDSDMYTFGFKFKPWVSSMAISPGALIRQYLNEAASESGIDQKIQYASRVIRANWDSSAAVWNVLIEDVESLDQRALTCQFFFSCGGYFNYNKGHTPNFAGAETFTGQTIHPQHWPRDASWENKKVVVIGSGATAMTLVPALAKDAAHVTLLQRSPTYIVSRPQVDKTAVFAQKLLPSKLAYALIRWRNILSGIVLFWFSRRFPSLVKKTLFGNVVKMLSPELGETSSGTTAELKKHFLPDYNPWDQRICLVPDGDLFDAINSGSVTVATDRIKQFTNRGIALESGKQLDADIIVTATGLDIDVFSGIEFLIDNKPVDPSSAYCYKGMMLSGVPNMAFSIGYTNASWTLKSDLVGEYVCRLLNHMKKQGYASCTPTLPKEPLVNRPLMEFTSGYVKRAQDQMPLQGSKRPWRLHQNYVLDRLSLGFGSVEDDSMVFKRNSS